MDKTMMGISESAPPYNQFLQPVVSVNGKHQFVPPPIPEAFSAQPTPTPTVVQVVQVDMLRDRPTRLNCPKCQADIETRIKFEAGRMANIAALVLCLVGCSCGCCIVPYCADSCKDVQHECPQCNHYIGDYRR